MRTATTRDLVVTKLLVLMAPALETIRKAHPFLSSPWQGTPPGVKCTDAISQTLNTLPPSQLLDILAQMKTLATTEPQRAAELLSQAPQLGAAIFQALLLMGLVSPEAIQLVVQGGPLLRPPAQPSLPLMYLDTKAPQLPTARHRFPARPTRLLLLMGTALLRLLSLLLPQPLSPLPQLRIPRLLCELF
uniref:Cleavage stimulation factor subunit 2 hinge domain-containing protein n=1 Tax=Bionectria ochroleuca TaxID=29856 RepID=A0A8H7N9G3_BIOOC